MDSVLSYYSAGDADDEFTLLAKFPFQTQDLKQIRINSVNAKAPFDVRISALHIRADGLPNAVLPETAPVRGNLSLWLALTLLTLLAVGALFAYYQRRRIGKIPAE